MIFPRKTYNIFLSECLKETLKELYFNKLRKEKFKRLRENYHITFTNGIEVVTKLAMYCVVNNIADEQTYKKVEAFFKAKNYPHKTIFHENEEVITFAVNNIV